MKNTLAHLTDNYRELEEQHGNGVKHIHKTLRDFAFFVRALQFQGNFGMLAAAILAVAAAMNRKG